MTILILWGSSIIENLRFGSAVLTSNFHSFLEAFLHYLDFGETTYSLL